MQILNIKYIYHDHKFCNPFIHYSSKTLINLCQTTRHSIPEDGTVVVVSVIIVVIIIIVTSVLRIIIINKTFLMFLKNPCIILDHCAAV